MQEKMAGELVDSMAGDLASIQKKAVKDLQSGICDQVTIANFREGEILEVKGLKFRVTNVRLEKRKLTLKML